MDKRVITIFIIENVINCIFSKKKKTTYALFIKLYHLFLTGTSSATESNMKGQILKRNTTIILTLTCSSSMQIFDNMAEFLIDHKSTNVIKYNNGICFDKDGECLQNTCACFKSGNSFSWVYKSHVIPQFQEFSCVIHIREDMNGFHYSVYTTLTYNGTGKTCLVHMTCYA